MGTRTRLVAAMLTACTVILATPFPASAAPPGEGGRHCAGPMQHRMMEHRTMEHGPWSDRMLQGIELTDEQRDKVFELRYQQMPTMRAKWKEARAAREALSELAVSGAFDEARAKALADQGARAMADIATMRARLKADVYQVLNEEQRQALRQRMDSHHRHGPMRMGAPDLDDEGWERS